MTLRAALEAALPTALAEADDAGSTPDDWTGSEYVMRIADSLARSIPDPFTSFAQKLVDHLDGLHGECHCRREVEVLIPDPEAGS